MERVLRGRDSREEAIFEFLDDCRKRKLTPDKAIKALQVELGIEPRLGVIWLRRHTSCFMEER